MRSLLPNFAFEDELRDPAHQPGRQTLRAIEDLCGTLVVLADDGDQLVLPTDNRLTGRPAWWPEVDCVPAARVGQAGEKSVGQPVPWGWSAAALRVFSQTTSAGPSLDAVRHVNSREFLAEFDGSLAVSSLEGPVADGPVAQGPLCGRFCRCEADWVSAVQTLTPAGQQWCTKPQWSHAGRNRLMGRGTTLNDQQRGWLTKHLSTGVYVEPWYDIQREWSLQFDIAATSQEVRLIGVTELLNDEMGRYAGNLICCDDWNGGNILQGDSEEKQSDGELRGAGAGTRSDEQEGGAESDAELGAELGSQGAVNGSADWPTDWATSAELLLPETFIHAAREIAVACAAAGYWGPLGLDGFLYRDQNGNSGLRICNDINARYSMGRLALAARRLLNPAERGLWCQIRSPSAVPHKRLEESSDPCETARKLLATCQLDDVNITRVSPLGVGTRPVATTTVLLTGPTVTRLRAAQRRLQQSLEKRSDGPTDS